MLLLEQVRAEPARGEIRDGFQCSGFLEEVTGTGNDPEFFLALQ